MATSPARKGARGAGLHRGRRHHGGRAQVGPGSFAEIGHFLATGETLAGGRGAAPAADRTCTTTTSYGEASGVRSARKHIGWYVRGLPGGEDFRQHINTITDSRVQWEAVAGFFDALRRMNRLPA
jgi:tRNA-dihydrouridine synthase B